MSQPFRLASAGSIDRSRPLVFTFDGLDYQGYSGDTLASALIANGVHLVGRSFKYHRPRGILSAGAEEPNALITRRRGTRPRHAQSARDPDRALLTASCASSQNRWPSLQFDLGAVNDLVSPLFGAGFYYKTFMGPNLLGKNWAWARLYEPMIRRAAGLGVAPARARSGSLRAHLRSLRRADRRRRPGRSRGGAGRERKRRARRPLRRKSCARRLAPRRDGGRDRRQECAELGSAIRSPRCARRANVRLMTRTQAFGYYAQNFVGAQRAPHRSDLIADPELPRERLWQMRAREVVLATGAHRAAARLPEQRPAGGDARRCRAALLPSIWRQGRRPRRCRDRAR